MERGWKPNVEIAPNCPRCGACNTKFCYYNNYSLTQPRYFCKGCRRYWTKGGSLRNVPVGGGCRKSRRSGKSIRVSTNRISGGPGHTGNLMVESTSSSNIDIAQVYANFLNQPPKPNTQLEMDELPIIDDLSFHFSSVSNSCLDFNSHLPLENGLVEGGNVSDRSSEIHQSDGGTMYLCGFDSINKQQETIQGFTADDHQMIISNYELPPLPGEEVITPQDMGYWSSSQMMVPNHILQISQLPRIAPEETLHPDQLIGNKSSFDLSTYGSFFRP